jgi:hydroxymethylpyrimidine pyrophosphatase-like HAD family hydrolase
MIFFTDLDNTIIYSYKHDIGLRKRNVEIYQGREISFITEDTYAYLKRLREQILVIPTSTRTVEQYERIDLGVGVFKYALVCNGGVLLENGKKVDWWYNESIKEIRDSKDTVLKGIRILDKDPRRTFELRYIENLFVFTKCDSPEDVVDELKGKLDEKFVDIFHNGTKVYIVPKALNKGRAVKRFMDYIGAKFSIAAGDSEFDISMLKAVDIGLVPFAFTSQFCIDFKLEEMESNKIFSDALLLRCLEIISKAEQR